MPFKTFNSWLFDNDLKSEFPKPKILLKYNSPITPTYVLNLFILNEKLCVYLNEYFNNANLWYLDKLEFFQFIKKCVHDFRVKKNSFPFFSKQSQKHKLFDVLRKKHPELKASDILMMTRLIDDGDQKEIIYRSLGFEKIEKVKIKKQKKNSDVISLKDFILNFSIVEEEK